ncbi:MAG: hypothetical protein QMB45_08615 [Flavobacteriales bacterium]|jgi:hypothetical protein|tara:strand:+ start:845 stop:1702 length:858 start_codon:yes stop_codon:yes gene_type:complete
MKTLFNKLFALTVLTVLAASCTKEAPSVGYYGEPIDMDKYKKKALSMVEDIPEFSFYDRVNDREIRVNFNTKSFSFSDPNSGWNYSGDDDLTFVTASEGGGVLYVGSSSLGSNSGGTLLMGDQVLDISYTFCVSVANEALGLDVFFDSESDFDGFSIVMGIAGDFEALENGDIDEDSNFYDYFQGIAWYYIYDNEAQGDYEVVDWFDNFDEDYEGFGNKGFACAMAFENFDVYFSIDGNINVSGGEMTFTGSYFGLLDLFGSFFDEDYDSLEAEIVDGFGTMGCE